QARPPCPDACASDAQRTEWPPGSDRLAAWNPGLAEVVLAHRGANDAVAPDLHARRQARPLADDRDAAGEQVRPLLIRCEVRAGADGAALSHEDLFVQN